MRIIKIVASLLFILSCVGLHAQTVVKVSNVKQLLSAFGSNKTIELASGIYNITELADKPINTHLEWINNYDGHEPVISGISNLTLKGEKDAKIVLEPRYSWVMNFMNCNNLKFINIIFGHTEAGYCMGGVLSFTQCNSVSLEGCSLYGSGTVGTHISQCNNISFKDCDIYECTYGLAYIYNSNNISFEKTTFRKTGEFDLVEIMGCKNIRFTDCTFSDNYNGVYMPYFFTIDSNVWTAESETKSENILIEDCVFTNNKVEKFVNDERKITLKGNKFAGNKFNTPK